MTSDGVSHAPTPVRYISKEAPRKRGCLLLRTRAACILAASSVSSPLAGPVRPRSDTYASDLPSLHLTTMKHAAFSSVGGRESARPLATFNPCGRWEAGTPLSGGMAPSACWHGECQRKGPRPGLPLGKRATAQSFLGCDRMTFLGVMRVLLVTRGRAPTSRSAHR